MAAAGVSTLTNWRVWGLNSSLDELAAESLLLGLLLMLGLLVLPILEGFFGLLTRARLLELADQERPLLRRLSKEAPGTFEHTLMICSLAEEGARSIGANVDLIRTGSLYRSANFMPPIGSSKTRRTVRTPTMNWMILRPVLMCCRPTSMKA